MKRIYWLRDILDIGIWGSACIFGILMLVFIVAVVTNDFSLINFDGLDGNFNDQTILEKIIFGLVFIGYIFFFWGLFKANWIFVHFVRDHNCGANLFHSTFFGRQL